MLPEFSLSAQEWGHVVCMNGPNRWMSNDHEHDPLLVFHGKRFATVEAAYKFEKFRQHPDRNAGFLSICQDLLMKGSDIRNAERDLYENMRISDYWEETRYGIMLALNRAKYAQDTYLAGKLIETHPRPIVEITRPTDRFGNAWADTYWGMCVAKDQDLREAKGCNGMGRIAMQVRDELIALDVLNAVTSDRS